MPTSKIKQSIFIVTGMHRSGTSFTTSLLQSAGLDIGQRLIEPGPGNIKGFFESVDFVEFHEMVLRSQGLHDIGWTLQEKIDVEEQYIQKAKEIISKSSRSPMWGWKDPRTSLFLDFWVDLLPNANFILIYRSPWEVIDSLYRRGDPIFLEQPELAVKIWMHYNKRILEFYDKFTKQCFLVSIYSIVERTQAFINGINAKFQVNLVTSAADLYEQSLLQTAVLDVHRPTLVSYYFPQVLDIYQELTAREALSAESPEHDQSWLKKIKSPPESVWAFQDWVNLRHLERQVKSLQGELERSQSQLQQIQAALDSMLNIANTGFPEEN
jgi:hypothetical protein